MKSPEETYNYSMHLVCFLDILGQRERLRSLRGIPSTPEEVGQTLAVLKQTAGSVITLREAFIDYFEGYKREGSLLKAAPPAILKQMVLTGTVEPRLTTFSDSVIVTVCLANEHYHVEPVVAVNAALLSICNLLPYLFARRIPVRGGVDVGATLEFSSGDLYGAGLARAYSLESKQAEYPRVCVGQELVSYLDAIATQPGTHTSASVARSVAAMTKGLLAADDDGQPILDYLGATAFRLAPDSLPAEIVGLAYKWVREQAACFTAAKSEKLAPRYHRLLAYFEKNVSRWLTPSE